MNQKSQLHPSQTRQYLGFLFNSKTMTIALPPEKRQKLHTRTATILDLITKEMQF